MPRNGVADIIARQQLMPYLRAEDLNTREVDEGVLMPNTTYDAIMGSPAVYAAMQSLRDLTGGRLVQRLSDMASPVFAPQGAFGWADAIAGTLADTADVAMTASGLAGLAGKAAPYVGRIGSSMADDFVRLMADETGMFGGRSALAKPPKKSMLWRLGVDGKMRFEISDHEMRIKPVYKGPLGVKKVFWDENGATEEFKKHINPVRVMDLIEHEELFKNYPSLAKIEVSTLPANLLGNTRGIFSIRDGKPHITLRDNLPPHELREVMAHELQHAIQRIEKFARGANYNVVGPENYFRSAGEQEAYEVVERLDWTPAKRMRSRPRYYMNSIIEFD